MATTIGTHQILADGHPDHFVIDPQDPFPNGYASFEHV